MRVELQSIEKRFGGPPILQGVTLDVASGTSVALMGPSGSGKSTLLSIIGGLTTPTAGTVRLEGRPVEGLDEEARAALRRRSIGLVFQADRLLPQLTALENVLLPTLAAGAPPAGVDVRARELLAQVGLGDKLERLPSRLSGGERQRVAVARALVLKPALVLADEPTGSLDHASAEVVADLLAGLQAKHGVTLLVATHAPALAKRFDRVVRLEAGRLVEGEA